MLVGIHSCQKTTGVENYKIKTLLNNKEIKLEMLSEFPSERYFTIDLKDFSSH